MVNHVRHLCTGIVLLIACSLVAGCGSGNDESSPDSVLTVAWPAVPDVLEQTQFQGMQTQALHYNIGATLVKWDKAAEIEGQVMTPETVAVDLAESIEPNEDLTKYTVTLKEGVMSSAGNELSTKDVQFTFDLHKGASTIGASTIMPVGNVDPDEPLTIIDDRTFTWNLTEPSALASAVLQFWEFSILDSTEALKHATSDDPHAEEWLKTNYVGFGPYSVASFTPGREIRLQSNPNYFGTQPEFRTVVIRAVPEASTRVQLLLRDEVHFITDIPFDQVANLEGDDGVQVYRKADTNVQGISFNHAVAPLGDARVRRAINVAINRDAIVEGVYRGNAKPYVTALPSSLPHRDAPEDLWAAYDPDQARDLLDEAGYSDGFSFTLTVNSARPGPHAEDMARLIQNDLKAVGIDMKIDVIASVAEFETAVKEGKLEAWLYSARPALPDVGYAFWHSRAAERGKAGTPYAINYNNDEFDALVRRILSTPPGEEREAIVEQASTIERHDMPWAMLVEVPDIKASRSDISGYVGYPHAQVVFADLRHE